MTHKTQNDKYDAAVQNEMPWHYYSFVEIKNYNPFTTINPFMANGISQA